ncbi:MAG TPA: hypothetical protein DCS93_24800 [Microscillaceae bacterium]|nr:hypothetical protein [Microscillaceae bacterium]
MENHFDLSDDEFEQAFQNCTLSPALFSHEAHIRLAWIHITKYGLETAIANIGSQLTTFVAKAGASDKYNVTLTVAAVKIVCHFVEKATATNFPDFIEEFPQLTTDFKGLINTHYDVDIYNSEKAKKEYISPDLLPFE